MEYLKRKRPLDNTANPPDHTFVPLQHRMEEPICQEIKRVARDNDDLMTVMTLIVMMTTLVYPSPRYVIPVRLEQSK